MFSFSVLAQVFVDGIGLSAIYILIALGFTLLFGIMRVVNFAHGAFAMLGAMRSITFTAISDCRTWSRRRSPRSLLPRERSCLSGSYTGFSIRRCSRA